MKRGKQEVSKPAAVSKGEGYSPTPYEAEALARFKAARDTKGPRLSVIETGPNSASIKADHPDKAIGAVALMRAIGTTDIDFYNGLLNQLVNASKEGTLSEFGANFMLAVVKGMEPRDQIEAMLAAQMAAVHMASMTFARRLANVENIAQQDSASNAFNKLTRTYAAQVAALKDYRSKGEQKMTVQHVHVADGGQAIVSNVNAPAPGGGAREKTGDQPHALGYAPGQTLPCDFEAEREAVPSPSRSGA